MTADQRARHLGKSLTCVALLTISLLAQPLMAQTPKQTPAKTVPNDTMVAVKIPAQPDAIELSTGPLPGATASESWLSQYNSLFARNVTVATLRPFLPDPSKATGAAVIVAPGGGFRTLSIENEGWNVARALADKGVAAFVLKYRLNQTPADLMPSRILRPPRVPQIPRPALLRRRALLPGIWRLASRPKSPMPTPRLLSFALTRSNGISIPPHRHDRLLRRRGAHYGDHPQQSGRQTGSQTRLHRQYLRPFVSGGCPGRCAAIVWRLPPTIRCLASTSA